MTLLTTWPAYTNDLGDGISGTEIDDTFLDAVKSAIETLIHSSTNPSISPANIIDEVKTARGNLSSLNARLAGVIDADGNFISPTGVAATSDVQSRHPANCFMDSLFRLWPAGDSAAPQGWTLSGTGAAVARCGVGLGDTTQMEYGDFCAKITYGSATARLTRTVIAAADFPSGLKGKKIAMGIRCKASVANLASIIIDDGVSTTRGGQAGNGTYHTGGGSEEWLYVVHTMSASATKLDIALEVAQSGSAYFGAGNLARSNVALTEWWTERWGWILKGFQIRGNLAVADGQNSWWPPMEFPALLYGMTAVVQTAPVSTAITFDIDKASAPGASPSWSGNYTSKPTIAAGAYVTTTSPTRPDGTYANRCFAPGNIARLNIDTVGTGTVGADASGVILFWVPIPEYDTLMV